MEFCGSVPPSDAEDRDHAGRRPDASSLFWRRGEVFDQGELGAGLKLAKVNLIHEGADEKDAAAGTAEQVLRGEGIGEMFPVHAFALVGDGKDEGFAVVFEAGSHLLGRVIVVAVENGVYGCFADGHGDTEAFVLVDAGLRG